MHRVAVVTGGNKGIGFGIVKSLASHFEGIIYLTARNEQLGTDALKEIQKEIQEQTEKERLRFHKLDITVPSSITKLKDHLISNHGGLDILINNAGMAFKQASTAPFGEQAEITTRTNYFGTKDVCDILFGVLKPHARVVNIASTSGLLSGYSDEIRAKVTSDSLTADELDEIVNSFIHSAKDGSHTKRSYKNSAYGVSKMAEIALTRIQGREMGKDPREDIYVSCCCPGYVNTDMTSHRGHLSITEGAETPVFLALLPPKPPVHNGSFWIRKKVVDWVHS